MTKMLFERLAIIGVGLIGGSLARVLKRERACQYIVGYGRNEANLKKAMDLGVIDEYATDAAHAVINADVVVLATPLATTEPLFKRMVDNFKADVVITDVGSAKGSVVEAARNTLHKHLVNFVPGHPIAGTEKSGVEASFAELFENHLVILTPDPDTSVRALGLVTDIWEAAGANVITMPVDHHDEVLAATSHLPHLLAYALVDCLASMRERDEIFRFAAGGFADFTRIASSSPQMWHDVCLANHEQVLRVLEKFNIHLAQIREAIMDSNSEMLLEIFSRAKQARDRFESVRGGGTKRNAVE